MDFFDVIFSVLPMGWPSGVSAERSGAQNVAGFLSMVIFPMLAFGIVLFATPNPTLAVAVALFFSAGSVALSLVARSGVVSTIVTALGCALLCTLAGGVALLLAALGSFYSDF